jgi:hypothetical protein
MNTLTLFSVDPTDGDELLEIGIRKKNGENLLLIVPLIPEGHKSEYQFCDNLNYDETRGYDNAFKMAFWLARCFPDTPVYIDRDLVDVINHVNQNIYYHLSNYLPDIRCYISNVDIPLNLCLNFNELKMYINVYNNNITTKVRRSCTGIVHLMEKLRLETRLKGPIFVQGGTIYGKESGITNMPDAIKRTDHESMNLTRNPDAFIKLMKLMNDDIYVLPTLHSKIHSLNEINNMIDSNYLKNIYNLPSKSVIASDTINECLNKFYSQDRFKNGAKLFGVDLYNISSNKESYNFIKMSCAIKKELGEMELHNGELDNDDIYEHFRPVKVLNQIKSNQNIHYNIIRNDS